MGGLRSSDDELVMVLEGHSKYIHDQGDSHAYNDSVGDQ
jgi:uncharacterized cupin superfamily protein